MFLNSIPDAHKAKIGRKAHQKTILRLCTQMVLAKRHKNSDK
ncbi:hypothetical protein M2132_000122 [Dysgonomonas sp. PH5-45]|nr:hypothetical protein [Dysgonomonas sp. PH5-45]MDH6386707.1 hypothetical protein [Dysgonomonas sp. PH5-37]